MTIRNEKEYKITKAQRDAFKSQYEELNSQIIEYDKSSDFITEYKEIIEEMEEILGPERNIGCIIWISSIEESCEFNKNPYRFHHLIGKIDLLLELMCDEEISLIFKWKHDQDYFNDLWDNNWDNLGEWEAIELFNQLERISEYADIKMKQSPYDEYYN